MVFSKLHKLNRTQNNPRIFAFSQYTFYGISISLRRSIYGFVKFCLATTFLLGSGLFMSNTFEMRKSENRNWNSLTEKEKRLVNKRKDAAFSKGEIAITKFLMSNHLHFYNEFYFGDLKISGKSKLLFFDFFIPKYNLAIEFDGIQHYTLTYKGKKLENQRTYDFLKTAYCHKNKINLLRIKYTDIDNIETIICKKVDVIDPIA